MKGSALLWQFRDADPEFGQLQAKELHDQLQQVLEDFPIEVLTGNDYLVFILNETVYNIIIIIVHVCVHTDHNCFCVISLYDTYEFTCCVLSGPQL